MISRLLSYALFGVSIIASSPAFASSISSTFDTDDNSWTVGDIDHPSITREAPIYNMTGGDPGGYISTHDDFDIVGFFAPSSVTGDRSAFYGGNISFDLQDQIPADAGASGYPALVLYGAGKTIAIADGAPGTTFTHFSIGLTQSGFFEYQGSGESPGTTPVSEAEFRAVLADLTDVAILADWHNGSDLTGLDNVIVSTASVGPISPVPLPASAPMFGAALLALGAVGYSMKRKGSATA